MSEEKWGNIKLTMFDGAKKCPMFASKLKATHFVKGVLEALDLSFNNELPAKHDTVLDHANAIQEVQIEAKIKNSIAINYLILCFNKAVSVSKDQSFQEQ